MLVSALNLIYKLSMRTSLSEIQQATQYLGHLEEQAKDSPI